MPLTGVINYVFRQAARNGSSGRPCILSIIFAASLFYCRCWSQLVNRRVATESTLVAVFNSFRKGPVVCRGLDRAMRTI